MLTLNNHPKDPKSRINLKHILSHPFFEGGHPSLSLSAPEQVFTQPKQKITSQSHSNIDKENIRPSLNSDRKLQTRPMDRLATLTQSREVSIENEFAYFTTARLAAMKQATKHGKLEILASSGKLVVDFLQEQFIILIDTKEQKAHLFKRQFDQSKSASSSNLETMMPDYSYSLSKIPSSVKKTVRYAAKFIDLVRSKTPKVRIIPNFILLHSN